MVKGKKNVRYIKKHDTAESIKKSKTDENLEINISKI